MMYCLAPETSSALVISAFCDVHGNGTTKNPAYKAGRLS